MWTSTIGVPSSSTASSTSTVSTGSSGAGRTRLATSPAATFRSVISTVNGSGWSVVYDTGSVAVIRTD